jgi:hypothetical protein
MINEMDASPTTVHQCKSYVIVNIQVMFLEA